MFLPGESQGQGAWWAAFYGVAQSRTRLNDLAAAVAEIFLDVRTGLEEVNNDIQWVGTRDGAKCPLMH